LLKCQLAFKNKLSTHARILLVNKESLEDYIDGLIKKEYGQDGFHTILKAISKVPNGDCGCELYFSTFPRLLAARGVKLERNYSSEMGEPPQDGMAAATPEQRELITDALKRAGFSI
jgi:hypothetical protein